MQNTKVSWLAAMKQKGMEMDGTVRKRLQAEWGWVLTLKGCQHGLFCFLKRAFPHHSRSRLALSGMGTWERVLYVGATGAVHSQAPGIHPHTTDRPVEC